MKKRFTIITASADRYISSRNDILYVPAIAKMAEAVVYVTAYSNTLSVYYKSSDILRKALLFMEDSLKDIPTAFLKGRSFCDSVVYASQIYRMAEEFTEKEISKAAYDYLEAAGPLLLKTVADSLHIGCALSHIMNDTHDSSLKVSVTACLMQADLKTDISDSSIRKLLDLYTELDDEQYLNAAVNDLYTVMSFIDPDNTIMVIENEKDNISKGRISRPLSAYFSSFLRASLFCGNKDLASVAGYILRFPSTRESSEANGSGDIRFVPTAILRDSSLLTVEIPDNRNGYIFPDYCVLHEDMGIYRKKDSMTSQTIAADQDLFYTFQCGSLKLRVRLNGCFFGPKGRFKSDCLTKTEHGYSLHYARDWGYFLPLKDLSKPPIIDSDVNKVDREMTTMTHYEIDVDVLPKKDGAQIDISVGGVDRCPYKLDFIFDGEGIFESGTVLKKSIGNDFIQLKKGSFTYTKGPDMIRVSSAFEGSSDWNEALRGSMLPIEGSFTVYFTDLSISKHTINIEGGRK
ncbi:MAG: hypothetical protein WCY62_08875 [Clostridia bacterium]|jgi:hypothetical protein